MEQNKVKQFKIRQERLARRIATANKIDDFSVTYEQTIPSAHKDRITGEVWIENTSQCAFPTSVVRTGKNRVIVVMQFKCKKKLNCVGKILKRGYWINKTKDGVEIRSSFLTHTIAKI